MNSAFIRVLARFKREDFPYLIQTWDAVELNDFQQVGIEEFNQFLNISKAEAIRKILHVAKAKKLGKSDVNKLDLIYVEKYPTKKLWIMHQLEKHPGTRYQIRDADEFSRRLKLQLKFLYKVEFELNVYKKAFWMRIAILQRGKEAAPFYAVYFPNTDFLATTGLRASHKQGVAQAFVNLLECHSMDTLQLKGYHLYSLFQMVCNRYNQGEFDQYKNELKETVIHTRTRSGEKRHLSDDEDEDDNIINENDGISKKRREVLERTFGVEDLPILQKVEYKLDTKFRGTSYAPAMQGEMFHCKIKFEGSNVLDGIRNLGKAGLASLPMKNHVGKIHMLARNSFNLHMKPTGNATGASEANATSQVTPAKGKT